MRRLLLIALFLEVGFVLMVVPWSAYWDRNYFAEAWPLLHALITNNYVRGAVSGVGVVNIVAGLAELFAIFAARRSDESVISIVHSPAAED
jgi:hypothetical protein